MQKHDTRPPAPGLTQKTCKNTTLYTFDPENTQKHDTLLHFRLQNHWKTHKNTTLYYISAPEATQRRHFATLYATPWHCLPFRPQTTTLYYMSGPQISQKQLKTRHFATFQPRHFCLILCVCLCHGCCQTYYTRVIWSLHVSQCLSLCAVCRQSRPPAGDFTQKTHKNATLFDKHDTFRHFPPSTEQKHTKNKNTQKHDTFVWFCVYACVTVVDR